jgi:hypothetical protein
MRCNDHPLASRYIPLVFCLLLLMGGYDTHLQTTVWAEVRPLSANRLEELRALLKVGLLPASPQQEAFLDRVVLFVARGTLSLKMVEGTFVWARKQAAWPYPYFEQALRERAKRAGVKI